jgi:hypothetical protein
MAMVLTEGKMPKILLGLIFCHPHCCPSTGAGLPAELPREPVGPDDGKQRVARALPSIPRATKRDPGGCWGLTARPGPPQVRCHVMTANAQGSSRRYTSERHIIDIELLERTGARDIDKIAQ